MTLSACAGAAAGAVCARTDPVASSVASIPRAATSRRVIMDDTSRHERAFHARCVERERPADSELASSSWAADPLELVQAHEHVAGLGSVGRAEHARKVQLVDDASGATVADLETPLQERRRALLVLNDHLGRLAEQLVAIDDLCFLVVALPCLECFALPDCFENVRLFARRVVGDHTLRHQRGPLCVTTILIPLHEIFGIVAREESALQACGL